jgi:hypothetical protein
MYYLPRHFQIVPIMEGHCQIVLLFKNAKYIYLILGQTLYYAIGYNN